MKLEPISQYIEDNTNLELGVNLFTHSMPPDVNEGVLVVTESAGNRVDHEVIGVYLGRFQTIIRSQNYGTGTARAYEVFNLLNMSEVDLTEYVVTYSRPRHTPHPIGGRSTGDLIELSINFDLRYRDV
tara:strand:- start:12744 stop:13127 length:384 start_codon:yes stop_codon:yes gene_type:complete